MRHNMKIITMQIGKGRAADKTLNARRGMQLRDGTASASRQYAKACVDRVHELNGYVTHGLFQNNGYIAVRVG
eukprot:911281-Heterocapsa_arctica.AAC.1